MDPKIKKQLHDKLFELRMKLQFAVMANEDKTLIEKEIIELRKRIAMEVLNDEKQNKKGK